MTKPAETALDDPLQKLTARRGAMWQTFAVPAARVMFVQVHKNACTSLKWMMAGIAGEDLAGFKPSLQAATNEHDDIHDRRQWRKTPRLNELSPELRAQIHPENGWFVFAVVRDPRSRLFSAWESKLLLDNPGYTHYLSEPWYPRHPIDADSVVEDFARFVDLLESAPDHRVRRDPHFCDQVDLLHSDVVTYTQVYDIRELGRLRQELQAHLDSVGWAGELDLPRLNDTPLRVNARPFAGGVRERIEKIYAADFERFGDRWDFAHVEAAPEWTEAELREADLRASYGRRLGYLRSQAHSYRTRLEAERQRAAEEKARADKLKARVERIRKRAAQAPDRAPAARSGSGSLAHRARRLMAAARRRARRR